MFSVVFWFSDERTIKSVSYGIRRGENEVNRSIRLALRGEKIFGR